MLDLLHSLQAVHEAMPAPHTPSTLPPPLPPTLPSPPTVDPTFLADPHLLAAICTCLDHLTTGWLTPHHTARVGAYTAGVRASTLRPGRMMSWPKRVQRRMLTWRADPILFYFILFYFIFVSIIVY